MADQTDGIAGTVRTATRYLDYAHRLRNSQGLEGTANAGDQTALNLYCHANPEAWLEVEAGWNYCLYRRDPRETYVRPDGHFVSTRGTPIHVLHGNGRTLPTVGRRVRTF